MAGILTGKGRIRRVVIIVNINNIIPSFNEQIQVRMQHGINDIKVLHRLIQQYEKSLIQFAFSFTGDYEASEDYVVESFMEYWNNRENLKEENTSSVLAFILTVVKNKCLNHLRHQKHRDHASDTIRDLYQWELDLQINSLSSCDPKELFTAEINEIVQTTLDTLPPDTRKIFLMSRNENKSRKEIADTMGMSVKGVEYHISKALIELRYNLKDYLFFIFLTLNN